MSAIGAHGRTRRAGVPVAIEGNPEIDAQLAFRDLSRVGKQEAHRNAGKLLVLQPLIGNRVDQVNLAAGIIGAGAWLKQPASPRLVVPSLPCVAVAASECGPSARRSLRRKAGYGAILF